jgi:RimJ/RimL family protein N-acetyltransferase
MVGFHSVSAAHRTAEITYAVQPAYWGEGVACAACAAAVDWGFSTRGWVRIQATTLQANLASQRVLAKCGFAFEGRLRNFRLVRGEPMDYLLFATVPADPADPTGFSATSHRPAARPAADPSRPSLPAD